LCINFKPFKFEDWWLDRDVLPAVEDQGPGPGGELHGHEVAEQVEGGIPVDGSWYRAVGGVFERMPGAYDAIGRERIGLDSYLYGRPVHKHRRDVDSRAATAVHLRRMKCVVGMGRGSVRAIGFIYGPFPDSKGYLKRSTVAWMLKSLVSDNVYVVYEADVFKDVKAFIITWPVVEREGQFSRHARVFMFYLS
jgi:hypothetical protein